MRSFEVVSKEYDHDHQRVFEISYLAMVIVYDFNCHFHRK